MPISTEIIKGCQSGKAKFQKILVEQSAPQLMRVALRYTHDHATAEDVLQDSYLKIFSKINKYNSNLGTFESWARSITIYTSIERYRKKYWTNELHILDDQTKYEAQVLFNWDQKLDAQKIYELINQLPFGLRTVFNLFAIEGYSHIEISNILDIKASTSRSQLTRARQVLQKKLIQLEIV